MRVRGREERSESLEALGIRASGRVHEYEYRWGVGDEEFEWRRVECEV